MGCKRALTGYVCITALLCFALSVDLHVSPSTDHLANKVINKRGEQFINPDDPDRSAGTTTPRERRIFSEVSTSAEPGGGYLFHQGVQQCCTNNSTTIGKFLVFSNI